MKCLAVVFMTGLVLLTINIDAFGESDVETFSEIAKEPKRALGAPRYSDVCFSPRWRRPRDENDPHDTFRDATLFHATRFDWVYSGDPEWIAECRKRGYWFTGTLNTILPDPETGKREKGRILNKNGKRIAPPWMRKWSEPGYWGCVNSPHYREIYLARGKVLVDGGVDAIQQDDPGFGYTAVRWGACHCEHCKKKADELGVDLSKDMRAFQRQSLEAFYADMRKALDAYAGRRIPWSSNNYDGKMRFPYSLFDYGTAELPHGSAKPENLYKKISDASNAGRQQIYTYVSTDLSQTRRTISFAYACGGHIIVPYDVWHGNRPRIFGQPNEYADLYGFARAMADYLDGYEDAAAFGKGIFDSRYSQGTPVQTDVEGVYAFVRARPGKPDAPVVIHLVDWRKDPQPFSLTLNSDAFFRGKPLKAKMYTPNSYDAVMHAKASTSKNFSALALGQYLDLTKVENQTSMRVPALTPWGILVVNGNKKENTQ